MSEVLVLRNKNYDDLVWSVNAKTLSPNGMHKRELTNVTFDKEIIEENGRRVLKHRATAHYGKWQKS